MYFPRAWFRARLNVPWEVLETWFYFTKFSLQLTDATAHSNKTPKANDQPLIFACVDCFSFLLIFRSSFQKQQDGCQTCWSKATVKPFWLLAILSQGIWLSKMRKKTEQVSTWVRASMTHLLLLRRHTRGFMSLQEHHCPKCSQAGCHAEGVASSAVSSQAAALPYGAQVGVW